MSDSKKVVIDKNKIALFLLTLTILSSVLPEIDIPFIGIDIFNIICPLTGFLLFLLYYENLTIIFFTYKNEIALIALFFVVLLISSFASYDKKLALKYFIKYIEIIVLFIGLIFYLTSEKRAEYLLRFFLLFSVILAVFGLLIYLSPAFFKAMLFEHGRGLRALPRNESLMPNPNVYGVYSAIIFVTTLILYKDKAISRFLAYLAGIASVFGVIAAGSKNGLFIVLFSLVLIIILIKTFGRKKLFVVLLCFLSVFVLLWFMEIHKSRDVDYASNFETKRNAFLYGSLYPRLNLWRGAINSVVENPAVGTGPFVFVYSHHRYTWHTVKIGELNSHNLYLQILVESGLIGFSIFSLIFVLAYKLFKKKKFYIAFPLFTLLLGQIFDCFLYDYFMNVFFVSLLAIALYENRRDGNS